MSEIRWNPEPSLSTFPPTASARGAIVYEPRFGESLVSALARAKEAVVDAGGGLWVVWFNDVLLPVERDSNIDELTERYRLQCNHYSRRAKEREAAR